MSLMLVVWLVGDFSEDFVFVRTEKSNRKATLYENT